MPPMLSTMAGPITTDRIVLAGIVTLASGIQLIFFARRVFFSRQEHNIKYPAVTGNPNFERVYRAHQNTLELYPVFMGTLWTSTLFFHHVPSAVFGVLYIISRQRYFNGYSRSVEERLPGFSMGFRCLCLMGLIGAVGMGKTLLKMLLSSAHQGGCEGHFPWRSFR